MGQKGSKSQPRENVIEELISKVDNFQNHALGAVVGAFMGDSIGSLVEFQSEVSDEEVNKAMKMPGGGPFKLKPGQVTDDSELALCLAKGLAEGEGIFSLDRIAKYYGYWINSNPFDLGNTIRGALSALLNQSDTNGIERWGEICTASASKHNQKSESNGGLMRITPLAVFCAKLTNQNDIEKVVRAEQALTHPNIMAQDAAIGYCLGLTHLINNNGSTEGLMEKMKEWAKERESGIYSYWECVESDNVLPGNRNMGWAKLAWTYAFISIKRNYNYEQAMRFVLKQAGDTDTNCAIVGGMVGARLGFKKLYEDHQELVEKFWNCKVDEYPQKRDKFFDPRNVIDYTMNIIKKTPSKLYYAGRLGEEEELRAKMANDL